MKNKKPKALIKKKPPARAKRARGLYFSLLRKQCEDGNTSVTTTIMKMFIQMSLSVNLFSRCSPEDRDMDPFRLEDDDMEWLHDLIQKQLSAKIKKIESLQVIGVLVEGLI